MNKNLPTTEKNDTEFELPHQVAIIYSDVQRDYFPTEAQYITEKDAFDDARLIGAYLSSLGVQVCLYPGDAALAENSAQG